MGTFWFCLLVVLALVGYALTTYWGNKLSRKQDSEPPKQAWEPESGCGMDSFLSEQEKTDKVSGKFLYCVTDFSIFKQDESYWLEYIGDDTYCGRSDNILDRKVKITPRQLELYFSETPRSSFERELAQWFYGMRTWGLVHGESNSNFCDSQAHIAVENLLNHLEKTPTKSDN